MVPNHPYHKQRGRRRGREEEEEGQTWIKKGRERKERERERIVWEATRSSERIQSQECLQKLTGMNNIDVSKQQEIYNSAASSL